MINFEKELDGDDLRSIGNANKIVSLVRDQSSFDQLFRLLFHAKRQIVMRAADAIEKLTIQHPEYLTPHKKELFEISLHDNKIELKWHLAQLLPRIEFNKAEKRKAWEILFEWASNKNESKIVRVNALQGLDILLPTMTEQKEELMDLVASVYKENIPSINARIRKLRNIQ